MLRHSAKVFCWQLHTFVHRGRRKEEQDICSALQKLLHLAGLPGVDSLDLSIANNSAKLLLFALQCYINQNMHAYLLVNPPHIGTTPVAYPLAPSPHISTTPVVPPSPCTTKDWYYLTRVGPCKITSNTSDTFC